MNLTDFNVIANILVDAAHEMKRGQRPLEEEQIETLISTFSMNFEDRWKRFRKREFEDYVRTMSSIHLRMNTLDSISKNNKKGK